MDLFSIFIECILIIISRITLSSIPIGIISIVVSLITFLSYFSLITVILQRVTTRTSDLFQYKLRNKYLSLFFASIYILIFIVLLYGLRIYNIHRTIDLKEVYQSCLLILDILMLMPFVLVFDLVLLCILTLLLLLLFLLSFHNFFTHHIFMLYLYYTCSQDQETLRQSQRKRHKVPARIYYLHKFQTKLYQLLFNISKTDIILYSLYQLSYKVIKMRKGLYFDYKTLSDYHPYSFLSTLVYRQRRRKVYNLFVTLSPFIAVIYDCIFNDWVLDHVYYYLLIYIPIILIRRITTFISLDPSYMLNIIWDIYYKQDNNCIYAISKRDSIIISSYLLSGLRSTPELIDLQLSNIPYSLYHNISFSLSNEERNVYINREGIYLRMTADNRVYQEIEVVEDKEDDYKITYSLGEEWILLTDKIQV
jgi:hypothetical protein